MIATATVVRLEVVHVGDVVAFLALILETIEQFILILNKEGQVVGLDQVGLSLVAVEALVVCVDLASGVGGGEGVSLGGLG